MVLIRQARATRPFIPGIVYLRAQLLRRHDLRRVRAAWDGRRPAAPSSLPRLAQSGFDGGAVDAEFAGSCASGKRWKFAFQPAEILGAVGDGFGGFGEQC
jgi:hypothetical protein